ncbi:hypothetical protein I7I48_03865 [Histoplasma ohiense]|nr:hypothetical protein I7I48_03865 [Histoplasma ohiense (nom. inval.)]
MSLPRAISLLLRRSLTTMLRGVDDDNVATPVDDQDVSEAVGEDVGSDGSVRGDDEMADAPVLSPAAASPALVRASASPAPGSPSLAPANPPPSSYAGSSLSPALREALRIFRGPPLYPPRPPPAPTASSKTRFHTQVLYDTTRFASYSSVAPLARSKYETFSNLTHPLDSAVVRTDCAEREIVQGLRVVEVMADEDPRAMFAYANFCIAPLSSRASSLSDECLRPLCWRMTSELVIRRKEIRVQGSPNGDVALFYTRGEYTPVPCAGCARGKGPFQFCVLPPARDRPAGRPRPCCNCLWSSKGSSCSFVTSDATPRTPIPAPPSGPFATRPPSSAPNSAPPLPSTPVGRASATRPRRNSGARSTALPAPSSPSPLLAGFSPRTRAHRFVGLPANLPIGDIESVRQALREAEACTALLRARLEILESLAQAEF